MKKGKGNILRLLEEFQRVITPKPSTEQMYEEIRMMKFKIRPLQGDITLLNLNDSQLIEALWNLGKLDDFFHKEYKKVPQREKQYFLDIFQNLSQKLQSNLNALRLKKEKLQDRQAILEMEIFKEEPLKKSN